MKVCPVCSRDYPEGRSHCPEDGVSLVALRTGASERPEDLVGQIVDGRYRVERIVGKGGMGTVYACRHVVVGKEAALKVLRAGLDPGEPVLQRFVREAQTANAIRSRHIVEATDFGQLPNGSFYVVMELLDGVDLGRAMRSGQLTRGEITRIFVQIADTLDLAHAQGVVHRDLKPDNVFLVADEGEPHFVKILDFGIAKVMHRDASALTETGMILGTPYYMSPEQARADPVDHRTDIYALGVIMYRAFTGRLPFVADSAIGVLTRHLTDVPELPSRLHDVPPALERIIMRCLEKRPDDRFASMAEVAAALREALPGAGLPVREESTVDDKGRYAAFLAAEAARVQAAPTPAFMPRPQAAAPVLAVTPPSWPTAATPPSWPVAGAGGWTPPPASSPSGSPAETGTTRGLVTNALAAPPPAPRAPSAVLLVGAGAIAMLGVGVALAAVLFMGRQPQTITVAVPVPVSAPAPAPSAPATLATAEPEPTAEASASAASASAASASAASAAPTSAPAASSTPPRPAPPSYRPPSRPAAPPPANPPPARRPSEIRSPFD